jgi:hypothetical protein
MDLWAGRIRVVFLIAAAGCGVLGVAPAQETAKGSSERGAGLIPFVMPWDEADAGLTNLSAWNERPAGHAGPVQVRDGHLFIQDRRLKLFGVNLCFGANFPAHDDGSRIAARLARLGFNAVRLHHMDTSPAPDGLLQKDGITLDPERLDRLDHFVAELKKHGIYVDMNLHVGRHYPGYPRGEGVPDFHKGIDLIHPGMIALQKQYAKDLLGHQNRYTGLRYADDPAVAIVEINNENGLMYEWWNGGLDRLPAELAGAIRTSWNAWLRRKYRTEREVAQAWAEGEVRPGTRELLRNGRFQAGNEGWVLEQHGGARAVMQVVPGGTGPPQVLKLRVEAPGQENWHIQVQQGGLPMDLEYGLYRVTFRGRANRPVTLSAVISMAEKPWQTFWNESVEMGTRWQTYELLAQVTLRTFPQRLMFSGLGTQPENTEIELADISLQPAEVLGWRKADALGRVAWPRRSELVGRTKAFQDDWIRFLLETERAYWQDMAQTIQHDMKYRGVVVGTQAGWSPLQLQAELDAVDSHAYWHHPEFPGRPWDRENWLIQNKPMAGEKDGGTLYRLGVQRVMGKPFLCTEYNHPAPNSYDGETLPILASFAAYQDWDAIFFFAYSHRRDAWDTGHVTSFFDFDQHPVKLASIAASAALFRRGDLEMSEAVFAPEPEDDTLFQDTARLGPSVSARQYLMGVRYVFRSRVGLAIGRNGTRALPAVKSSSKYQWLPGEGAGVVLVDTPCTKAWIGSTTGGARRFEGDLVIEPGNCRLGWAVILMTAMEGRILGDQPARVLVTITGDHENTNQVWRDSEHRSVGGQWGERPSLVEVVPVRIRLPIPAQRVKAWALNERGARDQELIVETEGESGCRISFGSPAQTIWYEMEMK